MSGTRKKVLFALGALAALLSSAVAHCDDTLERALSLASEKRYPEAREVLDPLLEREPGHSRARLLHGILHAHTGRVSEAIDVFEALRRDHPDLPEPYNNLAVLYALQGRLDDARKILLDALDRQPDATMYANLGDVYAKLAHRAYQQARELDPGIATSPERTMDDVLPLPETPVDSSRIEPSQVMTEPREPASNPPSVVWRARDLVAALPDLGETSDATLPAASPTASMADTFCAQAGGLEGRRKVADAALWLRSYGAEIIEVRHQKHDIATSYRVYLPPLPNRDEAAAKVHEIRQRGVRDVVIIKDGDLTNGISFGVYEKAANMHRRVADLGRLGYAVQSHANQVEAVEDYVIKARASGTPAVLEAAWAEKFPGHSFRIADCD